VKTELQLTLNQKEFDELSDLNYAMICQPEKLADRRTIVF